MSAVFNVSGLVKKVSGNAVQNNPNLENSVHFLIVHKNDSTLSSEEIVGEAIIQEEPKITCNFHFKKSEQYLDGNVNFTGETLNIQYEISLHYINSNFEVKFLETLIASNITPLSTFWFTQRFEFFDKFPRGCFIRASETAKRNPEVYHIQSLKCIKEHLFLYFEVTKKCILPISLLPVPRNEIFTQFTSLYEDNILTDFKIICEKREFLVHKMILAARSPVFRAMFQTKMKESLENMIKINDFPQKIIEQMVRYIYTDECDVNLTTDELQNLLMIANKYELENLKIICMRRITESVDTFSKAVEVILLGESCNFTGFKEAMLQFMKDNQHILLK